MTSDPDLPVERVRDYYRALDEGEYDRLADVLAADVVQERPDMTLDGREQFVAFMREERPVRDTTHPIEAIYRQADGEAIAAQGRLVGPEDGLITRFVDVFTFEGDSIQRIETYVTD